MNREQSVPEWVYDAAKELYSEMHRIDGEAMDAAQRAQDSEAGEYEWNYEVAKVIADAHDRYFGCEVSNQIERSSQSETISKPAVDIETAVAVLNERSHRKSEWTLSGPLVLCHKECCGFTHFEVIAIAEAYLRSEELR
jgi:hypothetical protein